MKNGRLTPIPLLLIAGLPSLAVQAQTLVAESDFGGHYYEVYAYGNGPSSLKAWDTAQAFAGNLMHEGGSGYLATSTTSLEEQFLDDLLSLAGFSQVEVWLGGSQKEGSAEPNFGWEWENLEGSIAPDNDGSTYANWAFGEPDNDSGTGGDRSEDKLAKGPNGWLDEGDLRKIRGFIVEYTKVIPGSDCFPGPCQTGPNHKTALPYDPGPGMVLESSSIQLTDPRAAEGTCGHATWQVDVFGTTLEFPKYLCAFDQAVITHITANFFLTTGSAVIEYDTVNTGFNGECNPFIATGEDPQRQEVYVYRAESAGDMTEISEGSTASQYTPTGEADIFIGAPGEFTFDCLSTGGRRTFSFDVAGMSLHSGYAYVEPDAEFGLEFGPELVEAFFKDLVLYKFDLLLLDIANSNTNNGDKTKLTSMTTNARGEWEKGNYVGAINQLNDNLLKFLLEAAFTSETDNDFGKLEVRARNIVFTAEKGASFLP